jgi:ABC-type amino acid transport substrate-binding protein
MGAISLTRYKIIRTSLKTKAIVCAGILLCFLFSLSGCSQKHRKTLDINDLSGTIIGVIMGYGPDYILSNEFKDIDLRRYDSNTDMELALSFNQLDAIAYEMDEAYVFCRLQPEFMIYGTFVKNEKYAYVLNPETTEFNEQFNSFVAEFRQTDTYQDIKRRIKECAEKPFESVYVENTGAGDKVLRALVYDGWEPISYINTETNEWEGADIELITHFANSIGAKIEFLDVGSYTQAVLDLRFGKADIFVCPESLRMKTDFEKADNVTMSDWVWEKDIVFVVNTADYENNNDL